jgi:2-dehydropantoate 2-reductase
MGERILVWGAGAIGGTVGAYLWRAGHDVTFVDVSPDHVAAIRREGLRIVGPVDEFVCRAPAFLPQQVDGRWPLIALAVKAQHTEAACLQLRPHLAENGYVLSLQNGLCETVIEKLLGRSRTMGALVGFMGDLIGPGEIRFGQRAKFCVGELDGQISDRATALGRLMTDFEPDVEVTADIWGYLWGKLGFIALLYGTALGTSTLVELFSASELQPVWRCLACEIVAVAASENVAPKGFDGFEPDAFAAGATAAAASRSMNAMADLLRGSPKTHSGMWRDIAVHRRATEIGNQIGPVIEISLRNGVPTPVLRRLVKLIQAVEKGDLTQSDTLIRELLPLPAGGSTRTDALTGRETQR